MKSVAFFNNKGGVGKTTLACNVGAYLAYQAGLRVLLVDSDPQCNATQLVLSEERCDDLYWSGAEAGLKTLIDLVEPIEHGDASIDATVSPMAGEDHRFGFDILPGHPRMSVVEDILSKAWSDATSGDIGGIRRTGWAGHLTSRFEGEYDVMLFDLGPSLGSLNRSILLGCDYFVTPMGADIFSIAGIRNIAVWLGQWLDTFKVALNLCDLKHPTARTKYGISDSVRIGNGFIGYTVQQYITKGRRGDTRPTTAFERILSEIPSEVDASLIRFLAPAVDRDLTHLGDVPNMFSLIPLAQSANSPIPGLTSADGLVGAQFRQQIRYSEFIAKLSQSLAFNVGVTTA